LSVRSEKMYPIVKQANKVLHDIINIDLSDVEVYYIAQIFNTRREKTMHKTHDTQLSVSCVFFY
jgi:transcriptional regulatory protein LevR